MLKTLQFIATTGRDQGKVFAITEMPAFQAHDWAARALHALIGAGADLPEEIVQSGMAGIASISADGITSFLMRALGKVPYDTMKGLMDDLLACARFKPRPDADLTLPDLERHIEEAATIFQLQKAALTLHTSFFFGGDTSTLVSDTSSTPAPAS